MTEFSAVKVFSATKAREREDLGETITRWLKDHPGIDIVDKVVTQSSDKRVSLRDHRSVLSAGLPGVIPRRLLRGGGSCKPPSVQSPVRGQRSRLVEIMTVAASEAVDMVLSVRLLFLAVVYGGVGAFIAYLWRVTDQQNEGRLREFSEKMGEISASDRAEQLEQMAQEGGPLSAQIGSVILDAQLPPLAMLVLVMSSWVLPILILLVGYNRIAEDRQTRYTRYVLQRVHRESYLIGKILGHAAVCFVAVVLVQFIWFGLASVYDFYGADQMWSAVPRIWLGLTVYVLAYSAFTMLVSTAFGRPVLALMLGTMLMFALWIGANVLSFFYAPLSYLWLSSWYTLLWTTTPSAFAVFIGYTLAFTILAGLVIRRADL